MSWLCEPLLPVPDLTVPKEIDKCRTREVTKAQGTPTAAASQMCTQQPSISPLKLFKGLNQAKSTFTAFKCIKMFNSL